MALLDRQGVRDLLTAARATRNYCMLTGRGGEKTDVLIEALAPFDGSPRQMKSAHLVDLRKAMRDVCRNIDDYTLTRILDGDPPVRLGAIPVKTEKTEENEEDTVKSGRSALLEDIIGRARTGWPSLWQRIVLPGIAILLLLLAMYYTHWSFNSNLILARLDDHMATDVHEEVRDLIVIARAIEANGENTTTPGASTPAQKLFNQTMSTLKAYHFQEHWLREDSKEAVKSFDVLVAARAFVVDTPAKLFQPAAQPVDDRQNQLTAYAGMGSKARPQTEDTIDTVRSLASAGREGGTGLEAEQDVSDQASFENDAPTEAILTQPVDQEVISVEKEEEMRNLALLQIALEERKGFLKVVRDVAEETGRNYESLAGDHVLTRLELLEDANKLKDKISLANRFFLPMIYGSLGAALFCLVRVLTPALSDLGPARAFLRILFGAFAAMTLSMLFIPANVFSINDQSNPTLIFLACFLFGYSFDAVLSALHRLEAFLKGRLQSPEPGNSA